MRMAAFTLTLSLFATVAHAQFGGGTGEPNDPYQIWTAEQMNAIGADPNLWDNHFILMADIDLSAYDGQDGHEAFNLIGSVAGRGQSSFSPFRGVFDGNGHIIANFCKIGHDSGSIGLFRYVSDPNTEVKDLTLTRPSLDASMANNVGALVGYLNDGASISNCHVEDGVVLGTNNVGGLVGYCNYGLTTECHTTGIVIGNDNVGGLVGDFYNWATGISRCYATATVIGNEYVGGLAGRGRATNCYATSTVFGNNYVGGLVGTSSSLRNCYAASTAIANVPSDEDVLVGGLVGYYDSYRDDTEIVNCFYDLQVSGDITCSAGVGKMTAQMQSSATFLAWGQGDDPGVWTIDEGRDYPRLAWEGRPGVLIEIPSFLDMVDGSGTADDPYLIETAQQLVLLAISPDQWDRCFELTADLDLAGSPMPSIGNSETPFTGVFDGNGHAMSGYRNVASGAGCAGLFGCVSRATKGPDNVVISNLGLVDPVISAETCDTAAALVGFLAHDMVSGCYVEGGFVLGGENTGGLVGRNWGTIRDCYASTCVLGDGVAGGLVGNNPSEIINCYSTGFVLGEVAAGGLIGFGGSAEVVESFWNIETSGQVTSSGGEGKTSAQMQAAATFASWKACDGEMAWVLDENQDYPRLWWENRPGEPLQAQPLSMVLEGSGTASAPYLIHNAEELNLIGIYPCDWDAHFLLMADIDLSDSHNPPFGLIGNRLTPFTGVFDGNGYVIIGFSYSSPNEDNLGLFRFVDDRDAIVRNLGLIDPSIEVGTRSNVGSLVGYLSSGALENCYATGVTVSGGDQAGGLVGYNRGSVTNCYANGIVVGLNKSGGLIGYNFEGSISDCHATGVISGRGSTGGLAGDSYRGSIANCHTHIDVGGSSAVGGLTGSISYSTIEGCSAEGTVSGERYIGGLVGDGALSSTVRECYATGTVVGSDYTAGLVGRLTGGTEVLNSYATGSIAGNDRIGGLAGYNSGRIQTSYAIGPVTGTTYTGGLVGYSSGSDISCFWDMETSGQVASSGGTGRTTDQMQTAATYFSWAECDNAGIWILDEGHDYPRLWWENTPGEPLPSIPLSSFLDGEGTTDNPYLIYSAEEMNLIGEYPCEWDKCYRLMADIDLSEYPEKSFHIIASFTGVFDGNGHVISNFAYNGTGRSSVGFFGRVNDPNAVIKSLGLVDPNINGGTGEMIGALVGYLSEGTLANCYVTGGSISGRRYVGGLVGYSGGTIVDSYATSTVSGNYYVGGLAGYSYGITLNSYAIGIVSGEHHVGGLVGYNSGTIDTCYCASVVTASDPESAGGLLGTNYHGQVTTSFWDIEASGQATSAGGAGLTTAEMQTINTLLDAGWDFVGESDNGTEDIWWMPENDYPRLWWELGQAP